MILGNPEKVGRRGYVLVTNKSTSTTCHVEILNTGLVLLGSTSMPVTVQPMRHLYIEYVILHENIPGVRIEYARDLPPRIMGYPANMTVHTKGIPVTSYLPTMAGGAPVLGFTISPPLPAGLTMDISTGRISGTPSALQVHRTYTVTGRNHGGVSSTSLVLTVIDTPVESITYGTLDPAHMFTVGVAATHVPTAVGGMVTGFTVSPDLPSGLMIHPTTGAISGTPIVTYGPGTHVVTASNTGGSVTCTLDIHVIVTVPYVIYATMVVDVGRIRGSMDSMGFPHMTSTLVPSVVGSVDSYSITPGPPEGYIFNTSTGVLSGIPASTASGSANYTVVATNTHGSTTVLATMIFNPSSGLPYVGYSATSDYQVSHVLHEDNTAIVPLWASAVDVFTISPIPPEGYDFDTGTGALGGHPVGPVAPTVYTVTVSNAVGSTTSQFTLGVTT